jgi:hypothetical protein
VWQGSDGGSTGSRVGMLAGGGIHFIQYNLKNSLKSYEI